MDSPATKRDVIFWALVVLVGLSDNGLWSVGTAILALVVLWMPSPKQDSNA